MSTTAERFLDKFSKSFSRAFGGLQVVDAVRSDYRGQVKVPVRVTAEKLTRSAVGISLGGGSGLSITIGGRTAEFDEGGNLISTRDESAPKGTHSMAAAMSLAADNNEHRGDPD